MDEPGPALAYNFIRVVNIVGVASLLKAHFLLRGLEKVRAEFSLTGVKEDGQLPPVTSHPHGAGDLSCGARKWRLLSGI